MPYIPTIMTADRRQRYGFAPQRLLNAFAVPLPAEANKPVKVAIVPTPGRVERIDIGAPIQGIFAENGVRNGALFVVAGDILYSVSSSWTKTAIGTINGTGDAVFAGLRDELFEADVPGDAVTDLRQQGVGEHPGDPAVAVLKRVNRLELSMDEGDDH